MIRHETKRKITAMLSMVMLLSSFTPAALAEATISEAIKEERPLVELIMPEATVVQKIAPASLAELLLPAAPIEAAPIEAAPIGAAPVLENPPAAQQTQDAAGTQAESQADEQTDDQADAPVYSKIDARVSVDGNAITVTITEASSEAMYIAVGDDFVEGVYKGESRTFSGLAAGEYEIEVDYLNDTNVFRTSVTIEAEEEQEDTPPAQPEAPDGSGKEEEGGDVAPVSPIIPPASGDSTKDGTENGSTPTTPSEPAAPPTVDPITPPAEDEEEIVSPIAKQFEIEPILSDGAISVKITGASDWEIEVTLLDEDGNLIATAYRIGSGLAALGKFAAGEYTVQAGYVTPTDDASPRSASVTVPKSETDVPENEAPEEAVKAISAKISTGSDYIIVSIESASDLPMYAAVGNLEPKSIENGGSVRFTGLTPGKYDVEVDYVNPVAGLSPFRTTAEIREPEVLVPIQIVSVTGGENKLSVTGTAEPGSEISLSTTPATSTTTVTADANGQFAAALTCEAGEYTAVTALYSGHPDSAVTYKGAFTVTAPGKKPTLTVDEIYASSTTVSAKTTPGVVVELKTSDWNQKATADERGIVRFTLPHTYAKGTKVTFTVYYGENNAESFSIQVKVAAAPYYGLLKKGDKGDEVKKLTQRLKELGYPVSVKSKYDDSVVAAVRLFQAANGLDVDGMAGERTQNILYSVSAIRYGEGTGYPTFVRGDRDHPMIYALQQRLKDLGYYTIKVDGIFGSGTQRAVRDFQKVNGLTVTGKADSTTQRLLYSSAAKPNDGSVSSGYKTLTRSSKYQSAVVPMQRRLKQLGYYAGSVDGYFGSQTYRAVRNFQSRNGLSVTGKADAYTQQVLYSSAAKAASGSSSSSGSGSSSGSSSSTGYRLLYWGCEGSAVKKLQNALISAGYKSYVRVADGIYGQWTYDAVRAYQKDHGLSVDGIAGKNTQNSLYGTSY